MADAGIRDRGAEPVRQRRPAGDMGFTLIELLVVIAILGILLAIAVPSYLAFFGRAGQKSASADVRAAIPDVEAYYDDVGNYTNLTTSSGDTPDTSGLHGIDSGVSPNVTVSVAGSGSSQTYCLGATVSSKTSSYRGGPGAAGTSAHWYATANCSGTAQATAP
jgi:prepilin-type N-terminal cleavage/methylation domain-containing protein